MVLNNDFYYETANCPRIAKCEFSFPVFEGFWLVRFFFLEREVVKNNCSLEFIRHNDGKQSVDSENTNTIIFKDENFENKAKDKKHVHHIKVMLDT